VAAVGTLAGPYCPACGSLNARFLWTIDANADGPTDRPYELWHCPQCRTGITWPPPPREAEAPLPQATPHDRRGAKGWSPAEALLAALEGQRLREIHRHSRPPGRLLEVGAGKGRFLARARRRGWSAQGLDPSPRQVTAAQARYGIEVLLADLEEAELPERSFDVVAAWHVLEHLRDPTPFLARVRRLLRPGGIFAFEVPNFDSWQARLTSRHWLHLDIPRHLFHYNPDSLEALLGEHGFAVREQGTLSFAFGPFGLLQSAMNAAGLRPNWLYCWLRRTLPDPRLSRLILNAGVGLAGALPALCVELAAASVGRGAVVRMVAAPIDGAGPLRRREPTSTPARWRRA
jgi:SAM-dependent methyltransferase